MRAKNRSLHIDPRGSRASVPGRADHRSPACAKALRHSGLDPKSRRTPGREVEGTIGLDPGPVSKHGGRLSAGVLEGQAFRLLAGGRAPGRRNAQQVGRRPGVQRSRRLTLQAPGHA